MIGLDIGNRKVKLVSLGPHKKGRYKLERWGVADLPKGVITSQSESLWGRVAEVIKKLVVETKAGDKQVVASVPESEEVYTKLMVEPKMSMAELKSAIPWEAEQYIPVPLSEVNYSFEVVGEKGEGGMEVLLVAASKRLVGKYEKLLGMAGLTPAALETELVALARCLPPEGRKTVMIVEIGSRLASMGVVREGKLVLTRSITVAGESFTRALVTNLGLSEDQAEQYKRSYGLDESQVEGKVAKAMRPLVDSLVGEVKKTVNFYQSKQGREPVEMVVISGGGAKMTGLVQVLAEGVGLEVQVGNPLAKLEVKEEDKKQLESMWLEMAVAFGLAMREG
jgi:type IV pilus assembly protein PilM